MRVENPKLVVEPGAGRTGKLAMVAYQFQHKCLRGHRLAVGITKYHAFSKIYSELLVVFWNGHCWNGHKWSSWLMLIGGWPYRNDTGAMASSKQLLGFRKSVGLNYTKLHPHRSFREVTNWLPALE
jgi:hypothetical protein